MLSQVTATSVGMVALLNTGFVSTLSKSLWGVLEVVDDSPVHTPRVWTTSDIDKNARKLFVNLINILSSFSAVYEVLHNKQLPSRREYSFRDMPDTVIVSTTSGVAAYLIAPSFIVVSRQYHIYEVKVSRF